MEEKLKGYKVFREVLTNTSKLYYVRRFSRRYVIKEYTNYRFLSEENRRDASSGLLEVDRRAQTFLEHLRRVSRLMRRGCRANGLLNIPLDVFRQGVYIYKVTRMVDVCSIEPFQLHSRLTEQQMDIFLKTVLTQLDLLQRMRLVHGDIKPENVLVTERERCYSAVVIDYEGGIVLDGGWDGHNIEYTPEYASPEMLAFQSARNGGAEDEIQAAYEKLNYATDIFSAGCVFVAILTGTVLGWRSEGGPLIVPGELLKQDVPLWIPKFHPFWRMLVKNMLRYAPEERPTADELLDALQAGEDAGLIEQLEHPFQELQGYVFEGAPLREGREWEGDRRWAVWHLDDAWEADLPELPILVRQRHAAQRRRKYLTALLEKLSGCPTAPVPLPQGKLVVQGTLCFLVQRLPEGERLTIEAFAKEYHSWPAAKRIMLELLELVNRLHSAGLLNCAVTKEDVWIVKDSDGIAHPFLARPQRFLLMGQIPEPEDLDLPADILAPELCMYLGCQNAEDRQAIAEMIGTWSDVFSLGLIYHLLLCGELPAMAAPEYVYPGLAAQENEAGESGLLFSGGLSAVQQAILRKMTAFEPEERIATCGMAAAMLCEETAAKKPEPAAQEAPPHRKKKAVHRWRTVSEEEFDNLIDLSEEADEPEGSETLYLDEDDVEETPAVLELEDVPEPEPVSVLDLEPESMLRDFGGGKWHIWVDSRTGEDKLVRRSLGLEVGKAALSTVHQLAGENGTLLDIERCFRLEESWYAVTDVPPETSRCLADQDGGITPEEADEFLLSMLLAVETLHDKDTVCTVIRPEDILITSDGIRFDPYENGLFLYAPDAETHWAHRVRRDRRQFEELRRWMAPELRNALESGCVTVPQKCDLYSLGLLYHWLLLGRLPDRRKLHLASLDSSIAFGRRWLLSQLLSKKRITASGAIAMVGQLISLRDKTHTFGAGQLRGEQATLYTKAYGREIFVAEAETDERGNMTCRGALPELEYFIRCEGETVECPIRGGHRDWLSLGTFAKKW